MINFTHQQPVKTVDLRFEYDLCNKMILKGGVADFEVGLRF